MPFYVKGTDTLILGTSERVSASYPIRITASGDWEYTGGANKIFDEESVIQTNSDGEHLFLGDDGQEYPWSQVEWRGPVSDPCPFLSEG